MIEKYKKFSNLIICAVVLVIYVIFMTGTGRATELKSEPVIVNMNDESEYKIGNISNEREYAIVVDKEVKDVTNVSLKIKDLEEHYKEDYRDKGIISLLFFDNETGKCFGEKQLDVQNILLRAHYAKESSDPSVSYTGVACDDLKIHTKSLKIVIRGKNISQEAELVLYGNRETRIEKLSSYDDEVQIPGNILCNITQGSKKVSTDFVWGLILIVVVGVTVNFLKMKTRNNGGSNGKEHN